MNYETETLAEERLTFFYQILTQTSGDWCDNSIKRIYRVSKDFHKRALIVLNNKTGLNWLSFSRSVTFSTHWACQSRDLSAAALWLSLVCQTWGWVVVWHWTCGHRYSSRSLYVPVVVSLLREIAVISIVFYIAFVLSLRRQTPWQCGRNDAFTISLMCWRG